MTDFLDSLRETIKDRLSSPLIGPYIIAFLACNYKAFVFLFSGLGPGEKIAEIDALYAHDKGLLEVFALPLAIALFYVFLYPFPARWIMRFTLYQNHLTRSMQQQVLEQALLTREEAQELVASFRKEKSALEDEIATYDRMVSRLKGELERKNQEVDALESNAFELQEHVKKLNLDLEEQKHAREGLEENANLMSEALENLKVIVHEADSSEDLATSDRNGMVHKASREEGGVSMSPYDIFSSEHKDRINKYIAEAESVLRGVKPVLERIAARRNGVRTRIEEYGRNGE